MPSSHTRDSLHLTTDHRYDSIYIDRWHTLILRGDTVFKTDSIYVEKLRDIEVHDTITVTHTDTISVAVPVEPPPRKSLALSERVRVFGKGCLIGGIGALLLLFLIRIAIALYLRR